MIGQSNPLQQLSHALVDLLAGHVTRQRQRHRNIVGHGFGGQQIEVLEDHPDLLAEAAQAIGIKRRDVFTVNHDLSTARGLQTVDQAQQGTFASAGMADDAEHLAAVDAQAGRVQGRYFLACHPIGFVDVMKLDHGANLVGRIKNQRSGRTPPASLPRPGKAGRAF